MDYSVLDGVKRAAVARAAATAPLLAASGAREFGGSRGATACVVEVGGLTLAMVTEGLGTKSIVTETYLEQSGESRFADITVDAVAAIVNDAISVDANPMVITAYFATGDAAWYSDERKSLELLAGWQRACEESGAAWGGGESPALPGLLTGAGIELGGSAVAVVPAGRRPVFGDEVRAGDRIVVLPSSGLHTNGASLARRTASGLPSGLMTPLPSGRNLGAALLDPSALYPAFVRALLDSPVEPHFLNPITGHGLLKMMRARRRRPVRAGHPARRAGSPRLPRGGERHVACRGVLHAQHGLRVRRGGGGGGRGQDRRHRPEGRPPGVRGRRGRRERSPCWFRRSASSTAAGNSRSVDGHAAGDTYVAGRRVAPARRALHRHARRSVHGRISSGSTRHRGAR
ncbi:AIR synthase related protein [Streptomyces sp. NTK 937]|uniref:AIR synthase related protein n=1 Tax=Streptomyces sp. NTK 937 TaxID=1487711 RepID=UPI000AFA2A1A|nr:AIR synthase related protein [Streptomyces sp. NTK 937]